jgi:hypothetical protein
MGVVFAWVVMGFAALNPSYVLNPSFVLMGFAALHPSYVRP